MFTHTLPIKLRFWDVPHHPIAMLPPLLSCRCLNSIYYYIRLSNACLQIQKHTGDAYHKVLITPSLQHAPSEPLARLDLTHHLSRYQVESRPHTFILSPVCSLSVICSSYVFMGFLHVSGFAPNSLNCPTVGVTGMPCHSECLHLAPRVPSLQSIMLLTRMKWLL